MVDSAVVVERLKLINEYTDDLRSMRDVSKSEYAEDILRQRAVERTFMNLIQACIDLAQHVRSTEGLSPGGTGKNEIEALGNADILSSETTEKVAEAVGFRNVLANRYGDINHDVVYTILRNDLVWFERFQQEVAQWIKGRTE